MAEAKQGGLAFGLKRVSLVVWSLIGGGATLLLAVFVFSEWPRNESQAGWGFLTAGIPYCLHKLTCWLIDGFSRPSASQR